MSSDLVTTLEEIYEGLYYGLGIAELGIAGVVLVWGIMAAIIGAVVSAVLSVLRWLLEAYPTYQLAKKVGYAHAYLAWVPIFGSYCRLYVLAAMPGDRPFDFLGKWKMKSRTMAFWLYLAILFFGNTIITTVIGILNVVPIIGQVIGSFASLLYLLPWAITCVAEYVFLKDVLDLFKEDEKSNRTTSIIITALDNLATLGFARTIYLYTLLKNEPVPQPYYGD